MSTQTTDTQDQKATAEAAEIMHEYKRLREAQVERSTPQVQRSTPQK